MGSEDDELGRTATAPVGSSSTPAAAPVSGTLGRYRIERELGAGGMGVVHAAFDPDLERRVALKVLRGDGGEARQRLLREARAMARLAHPNVVTVHEVGSANGRDYVAMELVDGETLADWLRGTQRASADVIAAFIAAGRGLAAAHAAGIVHRDFKPHNVLRHRNGRIVVTDFGLARDAVDQSVPDPLAVTVPGKGRPKGTAVASGSSPLSGLTATGSVLGTPAYMAPEQWSGGAVTPATDQFAYCVALWEALAGERPFSGPTVETLREAVERGPGALDDSKIPRRLRPVLHRGLDPNPKRRWPSMEALIAAMTKVHRPVVAIAIIGAALLAAGVIYVVTREGPSSVPVTTEVACPPPAIDPAKVSAGARPERAQIAAEVAAWRNAREHACKLEPARRPATLVCLDAVLSRLDVIAAGIAAMPKDADQVDALAHAIAPSVCDRQPLPRLAPASPQLRDVLAVVIHDEARPGPSDEKLGQQLIERAGKDACAAAWAHAIALNLEQQPADRERHASEAEQDMESCGDDRIRAEVAITISRYSLAQSFLGTSISAKVKLAAAAVERVAQSDLNAEVDKLRMEISQRAENLEEAIARGEAALIGLAARGRTLAQIRTGLELLDLYELRGRPEDAAKMQARLQEWRTLATDKLGASHRVVGRIDANIAWRMFMAGDVAGAHARLDKVKVTLPMQKPRAIAGRVVDETGEPVAGATVTVGHMIMGGSSGAAIPFNPGEMREAKTGADGTFAIPDAPEEGVVVAQLGGKRSMPGRIEDKIALAIAPTSRLEGKVDLRGVHHTKVIVSVQAERVPFTLRYEMLAPVAADGSFSIEGVSRTKVRVFSVIRGGTSRSIGSVSVDVKQPVVKDVKVAVAVEQRVVHVLVRSTVGAPVGNAQVFVSAGAIKSTTVDKLDRHRNASINNARQIELEKAPQAVVARARSGDLFATVRDVPPGQATACAIGLPHDLADATLDKKIRANFSKIEIRCVPIPADAEAVVVEVPPWPRLD